MLFRGQDTKTSAGRVVFSFRDSLKKALSAKILNIPTSRLLDHFHRKLQQTNLPTLVNALNDSAGAPQRLWDQIRHAVQDSFHRVMDQSLR